MMEFVHTLESLHTLEVGRIEILDTLITIYVFLEQSHLAKVYAGSPIKILTQCST